MIPNFELKREVGEGETGGMYGDWRVGQRQRICIKKKRERIRK